MLTYSILGFAAFLGGWCGSVPISVFIWWLTHHHGPVPGPDPNPWSKISVIASLAALVFGTAISSVVHGGVLSGSSVILSGAIGIATGLAVGSIVGKSSLSSLNQKVG